MFSVKVSPSVIQDELSEDELSEDVEDVEDEMLAKGRYQRSRGLLRTS